MHEDVHKPLRDDVRLLGELLGDALRAREGPEVFQLVEQVRALAKRGRAGSDEDFRALGTRLRDMSTDDALTVARAFAHFLTLANIAEQHHRIRRRRAYGRTPGAHPQRGSCEEGFATLIARGIPPNLLHDAVCGLRIELVLTAHPTEVVRRTLIRKHNRIAELLALNDRNDLTIAERDEVLAALRREVFAAWETDEVQHERPTPIDEVRGGLVTFEQTLWDALPLYLRSVDRALRATTGRGLPIDAAPIRFGTWMGGDRDGNPFVTPEVTRRACLLARWMAADLYAREVDALRNELSMSEASRELRRVVGDLREPYRALLGPLRDRLRATRNAIGAALAREGDTTWPLPAKDGVEPCSRLADLQEPLALCHRSLESTGNGAIAEGRLTDLRRRVAAFGLTLARLDIRQDAARHVDALDAITRELGVGSYREWTEPERQRFLATELAGRRPLVPSDLHAMPEVGDVLDTFRLLARLPHDSLGAYVVSMARQPSDVLAVALLQKEAGVRPPLRVVPLFETADVLARAGHIVDDLLSIPAYGERLGGRQEVMIGYSDSARDVGRFSAAWMLYRAQEDVVDACRTRGVAVTLFHGRGGSVGRGGGPTWLAIQSQPAGSIDGTLRVTEQGEMVQAKFGLVGIALRTLEVYTTATLEKTLADRDASQPEWRALVERLAAEATREYRRLVYDDPRFVEYFHAATPEEELTALNIGSRPARRGAGDDVRTLRAIPWQFAWMQTRLLAASWLGLDEALSAASGDRDTLRRMYREWPFFRVTLDLMEMVLAKTDTRIAAEYDRQLVPASLQDIGEELRRRLQRAIDGVLDITGHRVLVEENAVLRRSIDVRNPYVDPINLVQVEVLRRLRAGPPDPRVVDALMVTVNGIAAGLRNTG
jgi:phosphoenolpyruvate carboxylase